MGGFGLISSIIKYLINFSNSLVGISIGVAFFLNIIYSLFPLFFYFGIVLRCLPWTRAAGGAFLGLFFGFYVVFPLLLHAFIVEGAAALTPMPAVQVPSQNPFVSAGETAIAGMGNFVKNIFTALSDLNPYNIIGTYAALIIEPLIKFLFALIISILISFDFTELVGDFLGAPSLSSSNALKGVL